MSKQVLRNQLKQTLEAVSRQDVERQSHSIASALQQLLKRHDNVACYMSMDKGEVDTHYILEWLFAQGKAVYLPRCTTTRETGQVALRPRPHHPHLTFHKMSSWQEVQELEPQGKFQLREPVKEQPAPLPPRLDVMLVPGVAFCARDGARLGHGAGYYDDYFKRYELQHQGEKPLLIGLALKEQLLGQLPQEPHDVVMDCVVSGDGSVYWTHRCNMMCPA